MAAVTNKTGKPLSIPLPRGKTLHLGPRRSGQISSHDLEHPALKRLVDAGAIEIVAEDSGPGGGDGGGSQGGAPRGGHAGGGGGGGAGDGGPKGAAPRRGRKKTRARWRLASKAKDG